MAIETPEKTATAATPQTPPLAQVQIAPTPSPQIAAKPTAPTLPAPKTPRKPSNQGGKLSPDQRIALAIEALIHHNESGTDPKDRWFISNQTIADMTGTNNFTKVKPRIEARPEMAERVQQHNEQMGTTQPHHNCGKKKEELRSIFQTFVEQHTL